MLSNNAKAQQMKQIKKTIYVNFILTDDIIKRFLFKKK